MSQKEECGASRVTCPNEGRIVRTEAQITGLGYEMRDVKRNTEQILNHVQETNGKVRTLELWRAKVDGFKAGTKGSWVTLGSILVTGVNLLTLVYLIHQISTMPK